MPRGVKFEMVGRRDKDGTDYYFTTANVPMLVDLSKAVIFVHPWEDANGKFGADLVIKMYVEKGDQKSVNGKKSS